MLDVLVITSHHPICMYLNLRIGHTGMHTTCTAAAGRILICAAAACCTSIVLQQHHAHWICTTVTPSLVLQNHVAPSLVLQQHVVVWGKANEGAHEVFQAGALLGESVDDGSAVGNQRGLRKVGQQGSDRVQRMELLLALPSQLCNGNSPVRKLGCTMIISPLTYLSCTMPSPPILTLLKLHNGNSPS